MPEKPPNWLETINTKGGDLISKAYQTSDLTDILKRAQEKYIYWDKFKHYKFPKGINAQEAWAVLKLGYRLNREQTPLISKDGRSFSYSFNKTLAKKLNIIDTHAAGLIQTLGSKPTSLQKDQLIISGLSEEAIASSQIEGANTSRKVAKEMIYSGRKPRNISEQMIVNNYQVMQMLDDLKDVELTVDILLDIQKKITAGTMEDPSEGGRFRTDADEIVISDRMTGETVFTPPEEKQMHTELKRLINFANEKDGEGEDFMHPVIKATLLHFWVGYLHPFTDGNGRTARAIFYWFLMKKGYWLFQYLSVSRIIKLSKKSYDNAFLYTEIDENDITYFLTYVADVTCRAIKEMMEYYEKKVKEAEEYKKISQIHSDINERQIALLKSFQSNPRGMTDVKTHQSKHGVVYETARRDLSDLVGKGLIVELKRSHRKIYIPNSSSIKKLLKRS